MYHNPVLLRESIEGLNLKKGGTYVDITFGGGGHSREILNNLQEGSLIAFDQDQDALANKIDDERLILIHQNFRYMKNFLKLYKATPVDGILADLGVSSHQFDVPDRGFSVRFDGVLDLRMNQSKQLTAADIINTYSTRDLQIIFSKYGELNQAGRLAKMIEAARKEGMITTTTHLKKILEPAAPRNQENKFFARVFQALRIEVNDEIGALNDFLKQTPEVIKPGGRLVVISYHSLEDRPVKNFIKTGSLDGKVEKDFYGNVLAPFVQIHRKSIVPGEEELQRNNRARSARLRIAERQHDR